jgi:hypothetical protein
MPVLERPTMRVQCTVPVSYQGVRAVSQARQTTTVLSYTSFFWCSRVLRPLLLLLCTHGSTQKSRIINHSSIFFASHPIKYSTVQIIKTKHHDTDENVHRQGGCLYDQISQDYWKRQVQYRAVQCHAVRLCVGEAMRIHCCVVQKLRRVLHAFVVPTNLAVHAVRNSVYCIFGDRKAGCSPVVTFVNIVRFLARRGWGVLQRVAKEERTSDERELASVKNIRMVCAHSSRSHTIFSLFAFDSAEACTSAADATGFPPACFFGGACLVLLGAVTALGGAKLLVDVVGFVYPAYMSFKSMDGNCDDSQWLTYWVVFSAMSLTETVFSFVTAFIPMYFWLKIIIIVVRSTGKRCDTMHEWIQI